MAIIDDMRVLAGRRGTPARQRHQRRSADEQIEAVIVKPDPQPVPDEPRRHRVEHLPERKAAGGSDGDDRLLIIAGTLSGQRLKRGPLGLDAFGVVGVLAADDLVDEAAITGRLSKSFTPRISSASLTAFLRWPCGLSIAPFSCATPRLLRVGSIP